MSGLRRATLLLAVAAMVAAAPAARASISEVAGFDVGDAHVLASQYHSALDGFSMIPDFKPVSFTPNVRYIGSLTDEAGDLAAGGHLVGHYFYVTGSRGFAIYDVADPLHPKLASHVQFGAPRFENEDVDTNGSILLYSDFATTRSLYVYDVTDKRHPRQLAELPDAGTHTMTCLYDCRFAYGSYHLNGPNGAPLRGGEIVDLRRPAHPKVIGDWTAKALPSRNNHDVIQVRPGWVLTASDPMELLDVSQGVTKPKVLAKGTNDGERLHTVVWPRNGQDKFILSSFETNETPNCALSGEVSTWDATRWPTTHKITRLDSFHLSNGTYVDGNPPANPGLGCSPHWMQPRPDFYNGGIVALGAYDHGLKFLKVGHKGGIKEVGHFLPAGAETSAAYWVTPHIVYTVDYARGVDIVRFDG